MYVCIFVEYSFVFLYNLKKNYFTYTNLKNRIIIIFLLKYINEFYSVGYLESFISFKLK